MGFSFGIGSRFVAPVVATIAILAALATPVAADPADEGSPVNILVSTTNSANLGGLSVSNEDVAAWDSNSDTWTMVFDGSAAGLRSAANVDAVAQVDPSLGLLSPLLLSFRNAAPVPGLGTVDDSDIVRFDPASDTFTLEFDGSLWGLTTSSEDVDAVTMYQGDLVISTLGAASLQDAGGANFVTWDEDLLLVDTELDRLTLLFDGSNLDLTGEDVVGANIDATTGQLNLAFLNGYFSHGDQGDADDIPTFVGTLTGPTSGSLDEFFDGDDHSLSGEQIDAVAIADLSAGGPTSADLSITKTDDIDPAQAGNTVIYTVDVSNAGPDAAQNVVATDVLPSGTTLVSTTGCTLDPNGLTCGLGTIDAGESATYTIEVSIDAGVTGDLVNNVSVTSSTPDPVAANNATSETTTVVALPAANTDGPTSGSAPGDDYHGFPDTTLTGPNLLENDDLGDPTAALVSFGGGSMGGDVTSSAADEELSASGIGDLTVNSDGTFSFEPAAGFTGLVTFSYRLVNAAGQSDGSVVLKIGDASSGGDDRIFFSVSNGFDPVEGFRIDDEDVLIYNFATDELTMLFDGGDMDLTGAEVDAVHVIDPDDPLTPILISFDSPRSVGSLGLIDDSDVLQFTPTSYGYQTTAGTLSMFFDGSDAGLTAYGEDVDGLTIGAGGEIIVSTFGNASVPAAGGGTLSTKDEDLIILDSATNTWELLFDGSDVALGAEDLISAHINSSTNEIFSTALDGFSVAGLSGDRNDVFSFTGTTGSNTSGTFTLFFDGGQLATSNRIDGLSVAGGSPSTPNTGPALTDPGPVNHPENQSVVVDLSASDDRDGEGSGLTYSIDPIAGHESSLFTVDTTTGLLSFNDAPDFETPSDGNGDNIYVVRIQVADSAGLTDAVDVVITVTDIDETPTTNFLITPGGLGTDNGYGVATDGAGNTFATGFFSSTVDFDPGPGVESRTSSGRDVFLAKYDASGNLVWVNTFGSAANAEGREVAVDQSGNVIVTGLFRNTVDFDSGPGTENRSSNGGNDAFVAKYDTNGNLIWVNTFGENGDDRGRGVAVDAAGGVIASGIFKNTVDFDPSAGTSNGVSTGSTDGYVVKYDANGNFLWVNTFGGNSIDSGYDVGTDDFGNTIVTGVFRLKVDFDPGAGTAERTSSGNWDVFVVKFDMNGDFVWVSTFGGAGDDASRGLSIDSSGNTIVTGPYRGTVDFDPGAGVDSRTSNGGSDIFVVKLDGNGDLVWVTAVGGNSNDEGFQVGTDSAGNPSVAGFFRTTVDFDPGPGAESRTSNGNVDVFVAKFGASTGDLEWVNAFGGVGNDEGLGVAVDSFGNTVATGFFRSTVDFDPGPGVDSRTSSGGDDIFVVKFDAAGSYALGTGPTNTAPVITTFAVISVDENTTDVADIQSNDDNSSEGAGLTYAITGGLDQTLFTVDANTGQLDFNAAPDFENPGDNNGDNQYLVSVTVTDADGLTDTENFAITVLDVIENTAPVITTFAVISVDENTTDVADIQSSDDNSSEGAGLTYAITGGTDQTLFTVNTDSGQLDFNAAPDFENPGDNNGDNQYLVSVTVTDEDGLTDTENFAITILNVAENRAPVITTFAVISIDENTTDVADIQSSDDNSTEFEGLTYAITGGTDQTLFTVNTDSGQLDFIAAPDFENPGDSNTDNQYLVSVAVTDEDGLTDTENFAITILNVAENSAPTITSNGGATTAAISVAENQTAVTDVQTSDDNDSEGAGLTYTISAGVDAGLFTINPVTGVLTFNAAPDFENPGDNDTDNNYEVFVTVTDTEGLTDTQAITVTVTDIAENTAPVITTFAVISVDENTTDVVNIQSTDDNSTEFEGLTYAITGGTDQTLFTINTDSGQLDFNAAPDFENPGDNNGDNQYLVSVTVTDEDGLTDTENFAITILNAAENNAPSITSAGSFNVLENTTAVSVVTAVDDSDLVGSGLTFSISGNGDDDALFTIDANTGQLDFINPPDYENPLDIEEANFYYVDVVVTDSGGLTDSQFVEVIVLDVAENGSPTITSPAAVAVNENQTAVINLESTDDTDLEGAGLTYFITGGADQGLFSVNNGTGEVTFNNPPDFENPLDAGADNIYNVTVQVEDSGSATDDIDLVITIGAVAEGFSLPLGGTGADEGRAVAFDASGNTYFTGKFENTVDFNPLGSTISITSLGAGDAYLAKYDPTGMLVWVVNFGGTGEDSGEGVAVDGNGDIVVTGSFEGTVDFDDGVGTVNRTSAGGNDAFIIKYNSAGQFQWVNTYGSTSVDQGTSIAVDSNNNIIGIGGFSQTVDFDTDPVDTANRTSAGGVDSYVLRIGSSGDFSWVATSGNNAADQANDVAIDGSDNVLVTGAFAGTVDFDPSAGTTELTSMGGIANDIYLAKYNAAGALVWVNGFGDYNADIGYGIGADSSGNVVITGRFQDIIDFDPGPGTTALESSSVDGFVAMYDSSGAFLWANRIGGTGSFEEGRDADIDSSGNVFVTGYFQGTVDFGGGNSETALGLTDIFLVKYNSAGATQWSNGVGGNNQDRGFGVAIDNSGNSHITGYFQGASVDFDPGAANTNFTSAGGHDAFLATYETDGQLS